MKNKYTETQIKINDEIKPNSIFYDIYWLNKAIEKCEHKIIYGNMTIQEFIEKYLPDEANKIVKL